MISNTKNLSAEYINKHITDFEEDFEEILSISIKAVLCLNSDIDQATKISDAILKEFKENIVELIET